MTSKELKALGLTPAQMEKLKLWAKNDSGRVSRSLPSSSMKKLQAGGWISDQLKHSQIGIARLEQLRDKAIAEARRSFCELAGNWELCFGMLKEAMGDHKEAQRVEKRLTEKALALVRKEGGTA